MTDGRVHLRVSELDEVEDLWATPLPTGAHRIESIPSVATNLSLGDLVAVRTDLDVLHVEGVVEKSGHRTLRIDAIEGAGELTLYGLAAALAGKGIAATRTGPGRLVASLPPGVHVCEVIDLLDEHGRGGLKHRFLDPAPCSPTRVVPGSPAEVQARRQHDAHRLTLLARLAEDEWAR